MMNLCKSLQSVRFSTEPKGIGSILSDDLEAKQRRSGGNSNPSLRRTLSADMSSQGWIQNNLLRKTCSSSELSSNSDSEHSDEDWGDEDDGEIFSMTDGEEEEESSLAVEEDQDTWSFICLQNQKSSLSSLIPPVASVQQNKKIESLSQWEPCKPYVHQTKKSTLSDQSLRMCTEALGCESGTDSSYHSLSDLDSISSSTSEDCISLQENEDEEEEGSEDLEFESEISKFPCNVQEKEAVFGAKSIRSRNAFPPPLSSASGAAVYMRSFKQDGRLLLQAVKIDSHKSLRAHRHGGRLQLRFISSPPKCCPAEQEREEEEEELKAPKCPESQPSEERKQEKEFKKSAPLPPQPQLKPDMFSNPPNFRRHVLKADCHNHSVSKECFLNSNFNSKEQQQQSLLKEVRGSNRSSNYSNDFYHKFCRDPQLPSSKLNSSNNTFCKTAVPASLNAFKDSLQSRPPSQSLITSPSLLNYPLNEILSAGRDLKQSAYSLPKLPLKEGFRRCKERKWVLNWEPFRIAIS